MGAGCEPVWMVAMAGSRRDFLRVLGDAGVWDSSGRRFHMFQPAPQGRVERRIQMLLDVPEAAEAGPDFSHRLHIERIEGAEGANIKVERAAVTAFGFLELLIAQENRAGDDASAILEQHNCPRVGV